jgi:hypothetical protein
MMRIHNASSTLPPEALAAFARIPDRVVLHPGEQLFRLGSAVGPGVKGNEIFTSPWWIPAATYQQITKTAHRTGRSVIDVARSRLAVTVDWNPNLDWLSILELKVAIYAWVGPATPQPLTGGDRSVLLIGHFNQAYVPDLAPAGAMASEAGALVYNGCPF